MIPVVSEVVDIPEFASFGGGDLFQGDRFLGAVAELAVGRAELAVGCLEDVQVAVIPAEGGLDHLVQLRQADVGGDFQPTPDRWFRAPESHLELIEGGRSFRLRPLGGQCLTGGSAGEPSDDPLQRGGSASAPLPARCGGGASVGFGSVVMRARSRDARSA